MLDRRGKDCAPLRKKKLFLLDMDGTIYAGDRLFPGAASLLAAVTERGGRFLFLTNNSSSSVTDYVEKVRAMGISAGPECFFTAAQAAALELSTRYAGQRVYCLGTDSLRAGLAQAGIPVAETADDGVQVVLVGFDTQLTFEKIDCVSRLLQQRPDLPYLATNGDLVCPTEYGFVPDCGALCRLLEPAVHRLPRVIGKPEPEMIYQAMARWDAAPEDTLMIGDRLYTDIAAGRRAGVDTLCVLTGEAQLPHLSASPHQPDYVLDSVAELAALLQE